MSKATQTAPSGQAQSRFPGLYTRADVQYLIGISERTLNDWINNGLAYIHGESKADLFLEEDVLAYLRGRRNIIRKGD